MKDFAGRIAVITGGGTGMGRELARQLAAEGCNIALGDVSAGAMAETRQLCEAAGLSQGQRITAHVADVADEPQVLRFRDEVAEQHETDRIHLLFNNAASVAAAASWSTSAPNGSARSTSAGAACTSARAPSCPCCCGPTPAISSTHRA